MTRLSSRSFGLGLAAMSVIDSMTVAVAATTEVTAASATASTAATVASATAATAATIAAAPLPASPGSMLQVMTGLLLVLGLLAAIAWSMKKFGAGKHASAGAIRVVGGLPVGSRERILVVEVADQWIVVGVTPTSITALSTMPKQESAATYSALPPAKNFSAWLQQTIDKRHAAAGKSSSGLDHAAEK